MMGEIEIIKKEEKADVVTSLGSATVYESVVPQLEILLPDQITTKLDLDEHDTIQFIEENGRFFLEKV